MRSLESGVSIFFIALENKKHKHKYQSTICNTFKYPTPYFYDDGIADPTNTTAKFSGDARPRRRRRRRRRLPAPVASVAPLRTAATTGRRPDRPNKEAILLRGESQRRRRRRLRTATARLLGPAAHISLTPPASP